MSAEGAGDVVASDSASPAQAIGARGEVLVRLERALGHVFERPELLATALRHTSFAHESGEGESNERLEFLGDSVLGLVVAHALFEAHPTWREGDLTRALHALVDARSLAELARRLELGPALALGRTEQSSGGASKPSILADAMEAVVGALYVDGGLPAVRRFVLARFADALAEGSAPVARDPKTELQERAMARVGCFPSYRLVADTAIEGDDHRFTVEVELQGLPLARATARTKRAAEREAARVALVEARFETAPETGSIPAADAAGA